MAMKQGETLDIFCPAHFGYGNEEKYSHFGLDKIPANSDLKFHLELLATAENYEDLIEKLNEKNIPVPEVETKSKGGVIGSAYKKQPLKEE